MSEENEKELLKNTIQKERFQVCKVVRKLGAKLSGLMITCGFIVFTFGVYLLISAPDPALSARLNVIFISALGFVGALNMLCGLLLLLGED